MAHDEKQRLSSVQSNSRSPGPRKSLHKLLNPDEEDHEHCQHEHGAGLPGNSYHSSPHKALNRIHRKTPDGYNSIDVENVQKDHESKKKMKPRKTLDADDQN